MTPLEYLMIAVITTILGFTVIIISSSCSKKITYQKNAEEFSIGKLPLSKYKVADYCNKVMYPVRQIYQYAGSPSCDCDVNKFNSPP